MNPAADCTRCPLHFTRTRVVWGSGSPTAPLMLLGEAPGAQEDREGVPFVGRAGQLLNRLLTDVGIERAGVYISNRVRCRPSENRDPLPAEREACYSWLVQEVEEVKPQILLLLGASAATLAHPGGKQYMRDLRGKMRVMAIGGHTVTTLVTYHPAAALRQGEILERLIREDLERAKELIA